MTRTADTSSHSRRAGLSLLEVMIALAVFSMMLGAMFAIAVQSSRVLADTDTRNLVREEANRAFQKLSAELRKVGWNDLAGVNYPLVSADRSTLDFRRLSDLDGNGYPYDAVTGDLEWSADIYSVGRESSNNTVYIYRAGNPVMLLGRFIDSIRFGTFKEDPSLKFKEIEVTLVARRLDADGQPVTHAVRGNINMRN